MTRNKSETIGVIMMIIFITVLFLSVTNNFSDGKAIEIDDDWEVEHEIEYEDSTGGVWGGKSILKTSKIWGSNGVESPYIDYAKINVSCEGTNLYIIETENKFFMVNCNMDGCKDFTEKYDAGTYTITIKNTPGDFRTSFVCYERLNESYNYVELMFFGEVL